MVSKHAEAKRIRFRKLRIFFIVILLAVSGTVIFFFSYLMGLDEWKKFDPKKVLQMQQTALVYDSAGNEVKGLYDKENRVNIKLSQVPKDVVNAFLAIEDARFYSHHGFDIIRFFGALWDDIRTGKNKEGGSTLSQQLVKRTYLTSEKTISRKMQEAIMAYQLEDVYSKDEILEMYLNNVYFGKGACGIETAAKKYFGKSAAGLTLSEGATLAAVINAPGRYAPHIHMDKAIERRNLVLDQMVKFKFITKEKAEAAKAEKIVVVPEENTGTYEYGYFIDMVLDEAEQALNVDSEELLSGGYRIYTTMDAAQQSYLEGLYKQNKLFPDPAEDGVAPQSALIVLDTDTGGIRSVIGGRVYTGRRCLNRAINMHRQPGSAIKPVLVYAPAVEKLKLTPASLILDEAVNYSGYAPKNFNGKYSGWVTVRDALANSLNIPAVKTFYKLGVGAGKLYAGNVGIRFAPGDDNLTLALGGFTQGVSPLELGAAFIPFSNGGYYSKPYCVKKITAPDGTVLYEHKADKYHVLSGDTSYLITSMLKSAVEYGTAKRLKTDGVEIAGKTGTSGLENITGNKDSWVVAYNPEIAVCCWMGYDKTDAVHILPKDITGGTKPAQLVKSVFENLYKKKSAPAFAVPQGIVEAKIDLKALEDDNKVLLAGAFTPEDKTKTEYFTEDTVPKEYSDYWDIPAPPDDLAVADSRNGYPVITFTPKNDYTVYRLMRISQDSNYAYKVGEYKGTKDRIRAIDYDVTAGISYYYYVIPVHPDIKLPSGDFTGPVSNSVAYTKQTPDDTLELPY
jgi:penicillin-binding protein 1A